MLIQRIHPGCDDQLEIAVSRVPASRLVRIRGRTGKLVHIGGDFGQVWRHGRLAMVMEHARNELDAAAISPEGTDKAQDEGHVRNVAYLESLLEPIDSQLWVGHKIPVRGIADDGRQGRGPLGSDVAGDAVGELVDSRQIAQIDLMDRGLCVWEASDGLPELVGVLIRASSAPYRENSCQMGITAEQMLGGMQAGRAVGASKDDSAVLVCHDERGLEGFQKMPGNRLEIPPSESA